MQRYIPFSRMQNFLLPNNINVPLTLFTNEIWRISQKYILLHSSSLTYLHKTNLKLNIMKIYIIEQCEGNEISGLISSYKTKEEAEKAIKRLESYWKEQLPELESPNLKLAEIDLY